MVKIKEKENTGNKFYTTQEMQIIKEKISGIKTPNDNRTQKVTDLINKFGEESVKKLIEGEVYLLKNSMILTGNKEGYNLINGNEGQITDYTFKNQNEILRYSMYEYIELLNNNTVF